MQSKGTLYEGKIKICLRQKWHGHHLQRLTSIGCYIVSNYLLVFVLLLSCHLFWGKKTNSTHRSTLCINVLFRTRPFSGLLSFVLNKTFLNSIQIHIPCPWSILFSKNLRDIEVLFLQSLVRGGIQKKTMSLLNAASFTCWPDPHLIQKACRSFSFQLIIIYS